MLLMAGLAIAAVNSGCGSNGARDTTSSASNPARSTIPGTPVVTNTLTKAKYIARADAVCQRSWADMYDSFEQRYPRVALSYQNERALSAGEAKQFGSASRNIFLPSLQIQFDDLHYLGSPRGDEQQVEAMLNSLQQAVYHGWKQRISSAKQFAAIFHRFTVLAYHYGINSCLVYESDF